MDKFKYQGSIEDFLKQDDETIDMIDGCLIDNFLVSTSQGLFALIETYFNCWTSIYTVYHSGNDNEVYDFWNSLERS